MCKKELFNKLDKNHDNTLSLEEFTEGVKKTHPRMVERDRTGSADRSERPDRDEGYGMGGPWMRPPYGEGWSWAERRPWLTRRPWGLSGWGRPPYPCWEADRWDDSQSWDEDHDRPMREPPRWFSRFEGPREDRLRDMIADIVRDEVRKAIREDKSKPHHEMSEKHDSGKEESKR